MRAGAIRPRVVAWESTLACNLACIHCRAHAQTEPDPNELNTDEVKAVIDDMASFGSPIFIISGGEPLMRPDVLEIASYARERGLIPALSPNGTLIDRPMAREIRKAGVSRISVSIDGPNAASHDAIRGVSGAFDAAVEGIANCRAEDVAFQINTTVIRHNLTQLEGIQQWVTQQGAAAWHLFMLVPTGRGSTDDAISAAEYEELLGWIYAQAGQSLVPMRVTCGPQFMRLVAQRGGAPPAGIERARRHRERQGANGNRAVQQNGARHPVSGHPGGGTSRGCMAADGYCFVSRSGEVYPCGYLPLSGGNVRDRSLQEIYQESNLFKSLRDLGRLEGRCGPCEYRGVCGGCRARSFASTGNILGQDPLCVYEPGQAMGGPCHAR